MTPRYSWLAATLLLALSACSIDYDVLDPLVDDPLDNINNPLSFSDEAYAVISQELDIAQEIMMPLPVVPAYVSQLDMAQELTESQMRRALLGRVLFYDTRLSATGETSCASCHQQRFAFGDNVALSKGIAGAETDRNSFALAAVPSFLTAPSNSQLPVVGYYSPPPPNDDPAASAAKFFWDARADNIVQQARETMQNPVEMGIDIDELATRLNREPLYQTLTRKAFRTHELSAGHIIQAIGDFMTTMSSTDTRFDEFRALETAGATEAELLAEFTAAEVRGGALYAANCASCHHENMRQPRVSLANNGLDLVYDDKGNGPVSGRANRNGAFKTPFLRNAPLTAPYMHDGRFATLRQVVNHYSDGLQDHPNLHANLRNTDGTPRNLRLSEDDKAALVAFLEMTADRTTPTAEHLSDPFRR